MRGKGRFNMKWDLSNKQSRLNFISVCILLIGLVSSVAIYVTARDEPESVMGYEVIGGKMYPSVPDKMYTRNLELYGGKQLVAAHEFVRWFDGLWEGRSLAGTIAVLSIVIAGGIYFFNNHVSFEDEDERQG